MIERHNLHRFDRKIKKKERETASDDYPDSMDTYHEYIVRKGDTLYSIAKKYDTTVEELMRINRLTNTTIEIGQRLLYR